MMVILMKMVAIIIMEKNWKFLHQDVERNPIRYQSARVGLEALRY